MQKELGVKGYGTWWKKTFGVTPAKNPGAVVEEAAAAKPTFASWLHKKQ